MHDDAIKTSNSDLIKVQKREELNELVIPMVDFLLHSGDAFAGSLTKFDA
jgi:hypothetical protein